MRIALVFPSHPSFHWTCSFREVQVRWSGGSRGSKCDLPRRSRRMDNDETYDPYCAAGDLYVLLRFRDVRRTCQLLDDTIQSIVCTDLHPHLSDRKSTRL